MPRALLLVVFLAATSSSFAQDAPATVAGPTIIVTADEPVVQRKAGLGVALDQQRIAELPLNGRAFVSLIGLAPGVALPPGSQLPRINGGRPRTNEYLYDGITVLQPEPGQVAFFPIVDAIHAFRVETNAPPAEFGRFNGGVVNLATRAGGNVVRGTVFEFARHEAVNARNYFGGAGAKPRFRRHQFGGVIGGPIRRDRTFFFADYQGQRQTIGRTVISTVPTLQEREGSVGTLRIPQDRFDPVARELMARYPVPTSDGAANNYRRIGDERQDQNQFDGRVDHALSPRDQAFVRLSHFRERFEPVTPLPEGSGLTTGTLGPQTTRVWALASNYRRVFSDRLLNELRVGDTRRGVDRSAVDLPTFVIAGYQQLGSPPNTQTAFTTGVTHVVNALTWGGDRHTVKAGMDFRWERLDVVQPPSPRGRYEFSSLFTGAALADFLLGHVQSFSIDVQQDEIRNRARIQEYFVQDEWRIRDGVTLNAGLRYTLNFPSTEQRNQAAVFNLTSEQLEFLGRDGRARAARDLEKTNFGPRLAIVADAGRGFVARTGYAMVWIEQAGITTPFTTPVFPFLQTVSQRSLDNRTPAFVLAEGPTVAPLPLTPDAGLGQGVFAVDRDLGSGYAQQWHASLQRPLTAHTVVEVAYVGSTITRVGVPDTNLNQLPVEQLARGAELLQRVPNPYFGTIPRSSSLGDPTIPLAQLLKPYPRFTTVSLYRNNVGRTHYHGLEARLEHRFSHGFSALVSYTRSRLVDDASSVFDASILTGPVANYPVADSFNRRGERDYSTGDIPHVFVSSAVWQLPFGRRGDWTLTGVLTLQSGVPVAVTQATNFNAFAGFGVQRPNLVGDPELTGQPRSAQRWFNTAAFSVAPQFTIGSSSRNPVRGPAYRNVDVALIRRIALPAGRAFELRAEVFNATNTPPLGAPNGVFGTAAFGSITTAGDPRVIQLAAKLLF